MEKNFDKEKFSIILKNISSLYDNQREFAKKADVNRTYISRYINLNIKNPPTPKVLERIAESSKGITTYEELMDICGYYIFGNNSIVNNDITTIPLFINNNGTLKQDTDLIIERKKLVETRQYFAYKSSDDTMLPLLGKGDTAIIEKTASFENGNTCLISLDNSTIIIRKILDFKDYIELHTIIPYNQPIKLTNDDIKVRNFKILGKVIRVENESAFQ